MATKPRPSFAGLAHAPAPIAAPAPAPAATDVDPATPRPASTVQRSRQGKRAMTAYIPAELAKAIRVFGAREDRTLEEMVVEALNDFLRKNGEHPAA